MFPTVMAGIAPEGSQFDTRQFDAKMTELLGTEQQEFFTSYDEVYDSFDAMGLQENLLRGIYAYGFEKPSAIQQRGIVPFCKGLDVIQQAQSGTGKTATFCSGILQQLDYSLVECQALVLAPTRELAQQIEKVMRALGDYLGVKVHACVGGTSVREDQRILQSGVHVVVGTPGRVFDMLRRQSLRPDHIKMFVLDEADEMLSRGFRFSNLDQPIRFHAGQVYLDSCRVGSLVETNRLRCSRTSPINKEFNQIGFIAGKKVCDCLLRRGTQPLSQIVHFTELSRENVKSCLLVLIHHNCVQAFAVEQKGGFGEAPRVITQYMALFDNIIHKLRFSKFIEIVSEELGKECEEIFEGLLQHGRLSLNQIIDRYKQSSNQGDSSADAARDSFNSLVKARFVERCPAPEPFLKPPSEEETAAKKRGAKSAKIQAQTMEQQALAAAAPMESLRFLVETDTWDDSVEKTDKKTMDVTCGTKRKQDNLESNTELLATDETKVLWRANFEEFIRRLRHKACIANVKVCVNNDAAIVLAAALELSRHSETKLRIDNSGTVILNHIQSYTDNFLDWSLNLIDLSREVHNDGMLTSLLFCSRFFFKIRSLVE
ncbi:Eukaryotic initiation factor 4A-2 [Capsicum annuum]|nr:Eukaryotic initiation factor 4A-2 [Capsicum annuum]